MSPLLVSVAGRCLVGTEATFSASDLLLFYTVVKNIPARR